MYKRLCGLLGILLLAGSVAYYNYSNRESLYDAMIQASSRRHGVAFELIKAVIKKESNFYPNQRGAAGEYGLMQIMPIAFTALFAFFPAGLVLYWLTNTALSILQQWRINKVVGAD